MVTECAYQRVLARQPDESSAVRKRKLLLHRAEIEKLQMETREKGLTIVPTKLYLKDGRIKIEIAVGKGKKFHDKREASRANEMQDEAKAAMARQARR